jgi:TonB family protein
VHQSGVLPTPVEESMPHRHLWSLLLIASAPALCLAPNGPSPRVLGGQVPLSAREHQVWIPAAHGSEFAAVPHTRVRSSCAATRPPEALTTPDPLLDAAATNIRVTVSFIIGTDGRTHSPFILDSAGPAGDRTVLNAVRSWRYRPAMCNGVPTEAEGTIEFSGR